MVVVLINIVAFAIIIAAFAVVFAGGGQAHATLTVSDAVIRVTPVGIAKVLAFRGSKAMPASEVESVTTADDVRGLGLGFRVGGSSIPGIVYAGHFWSSKNGRTFAVVGKGRPVVVIKGHGEKARRLVFSSNDPQGDVERVQRAITRRA